MSKKVYHVLIMEDRDEAVKSFVDGSAFCIMAIPADDDFVAKVEDAIDKLMEEYKQTN